MYKFLATPINENLLHQEFIENRNVEILLCNMLSVGDIARYSEPATLNGVTLFAKLY